MALTKVTTSGFADGTDGQIITYDASGNPTTVGPGTDGQVLTSTGAGSPPAFEDASASVGGATGVQFNDGVKATFGTTGTGDLEIHHSSDHSYIEDTGTGSLYIDSNQLYLRNNDTTNVLLYTTSGGEVRINHNGTEKFRTISTGWRSGNNVKGNFGDGDDLQIWHTGDHGHIDNTDGNLTVKTEGTMTFQVGGEDGFNAVNNGAVSLYYDNAKKFETTSSGVLLNGTNHQILGDFWFNNDTNGSKDLKWDESADSLIFYDSVKAAFGYDSDLLIYHNGGNGQSYIDHTGTLNLRSTGNIEILKNGGDEPMAKFAPDGAVSLYHDNVKTFETTANGVKVVASEGNYAYLYVYSDEGDDNADKWRWEVGNGGAHILSNYASGSWEKSIECNGDGNVELYHDGTKKFETASYGVQISGTNLNMNSTYMDFSGDVSTPSTAAAIYRPADNTLAFSTANTERLRVLSDGKVRVPDGGMFVAGAGNDLQIYHTGGGDSFIKNITAGSNLQIISNEEVQIKVNSTENAIECNVNGGVELYYDNAKKFETTSAGVKADNICKAWCNYDGRDNSIRASFNVSTVSDNGTGDYSFNWTTAMSADFGFVGTAGEWLKSGTDRRVLSYRHGSDTNDYGDTTYLKIRTFGLNTNQTADSKVVTIAAYST